MRELGVGHIRFGLGKVWLLYRGYASAQTEGVCYLGRKERVSRVYGRLNQIEGGSNRRCRI